MILPEKQQKSQQYHLEKLINMNILPYDQRRVIEQPKFTYSTLGKLLKKTTKTIEDQGKKQVKATKEYWKQFVKSNAFTEKEKSIPLNKEKEIFYNFVAERTEEIEKLHNSVNFQNLVYHFKGSLKIQISIISLMMKFFLMIYSLKK